MKRPKKSHYRGANGRAQCGAHVPAYRTFGRAKGIRVTCKECTRVDRPHV